MLKSHLVIENLEGLADQINGMFYSGVSLNDFQEYFRQKKATSNYAGGFNS